MGSWKREVELEQAALPQFLRDLAKALETGAGAPALLDGLPEDWRKLVLVAERTRGGLGLKLKAKRTDEVRVPGPAQRPADAAKVPARGLNSKADGKAQAGREKYRQLKKSLQADYKALQAASEAGTLPRTETLESFLALAEAMCSGGAPSGGPEGPELARASAAFLEECQALRRAFAARDIAALADVLSRLARRKSACHAQFR